MWLVPHIYTWVRWLDHSYFALLSECPFSYHFHYYLCLTVLALLLIFSNLQFIHPYQMVTSTSPYLFIYCWLHWIFVAACRLSLVVSRATLLLGWMGFSRPWLLLWQSTDSRHAGFSSCGPQTLLLRGTWDCPRPGTEQSPALAGGFLSTIPPGQSQSAFIECPFSALPAFIEC